MKKHGASVRGDDGGKADAEYDREEEKSRRGGSRMKGLDKGKGAITGDDVTTRAKARGSKEDDFVDEEMDLDEHGDDPPSGNQWIKGAIKHPGALHRELGVKQGEKIPKARIEKAAHSDNPKLAKRARLAETLEKMHHGRR